MYLSNDETSFALYLFIHFIILRIKSKFSFESNTSRSQFPPCFRLIILMIIRQNQIKCACFKFSMENSPFDLFSNPSSNRWKGMERSMTRTNKRSGRGMKIRLKGRREKGLYFCFRLDDKIKATFDRDSKSSRNVPQLCYALTIGIFSFFFLYPTPVHVAPWPPLFRLHKFHVETLGDRGETWNLVRETIHDAHESSTIPINFPFRILFDNWRGSSEGRRDNNVDIDHSYCKRRITSFVTSSQMVIESITFTVL